MSKFNIGDRVSYSTQVETVFGTVCAKPLHYTGDFFSDPAKVWAMWGDDSTPSWMPEDRVSLEIPAPVTLVPDAPVVDIDALTAQLYRIERLLRFTANRFYGVDMNAAGEFIYTGVLPEYSNKGGN